MNIEGNTPRDAVAKFDSEGLKYNTARKWKFIYSTPGAYSQLAKEAGSNTPNKMKLLITLKMYNLLILVMEW